MTVWPERTLKGLIPLAVLLVLLVATLKFTLNVWRFDAGSIYFQTMTKLLGVRSAQTIIQNPAATLRPGTVFNDPKYGFSVLNQAKILSACEHFFVTYGTIPSSIDELRQVGLNGEFYLDPWKRPYRVRLLPSGVLMVQSTGPSGVDAISQEWTVIAEEHMQPPVQLVGDNLVILKKLKRTNEIEDPSATHTP